MALYSLSICESCARGSYELIPYNKFPTHASNSLRVGDVENPVKLLKSDISQMEKDERLSSWKSPSGCFLLYKHAKSIGFTAQKKVWDLSKKIVFGNKRPPAVYRSHWQTNFPVISAKNEQEVEKFDVSLKLVKVGSEDEGDGGGGGGGKSDEIFCTDGNSDDESDESSDSSNSDSSNSDSSNSDSSDDNVVAAYSRRVRDRIK